MADNIPGAEGITGAGKSQFIQSIKKARLVNVIQKETKESYLDSAVKMQASEVIARQKHFKELKDRTKQKEKQPSQAEGKEPAKPENAEVFAKAEALAKFYQKRNAEMEAKQLLTLHSEVQLSEDAKEILEKVLKRFADPSLADEALDYLLESLVPGSAAYERVRQTKNLIRTLRGREVLAGRNMGDVSRSHPELAAPKELRDLYREITGNPREAQELFEELIQKFNYEKMKEAIGFILQSLRADLTAKGPSISRGQLHTLVSEARNMQAILGVYRFFKERSNMIRKQFDLSDIPYHENLDFESLSKILVTLLKERYPSADKILRFAQSLKISDDILAQIIIFTQYRDAMRGVSPRLFKSDKHRQDMLMTVIEALSELEDELDEEGDEDNSEEEEEE